MPDGWGPVLQFAFLYQKQLEKFVKYQNTDQRLLYRIVLPLISFYSHPRTQQFLQELFSHCLYPNPFFTGSWCRTSWHATLWHHSSKELQLTPFTCSSPIFSNQAVCHSAVSSLCSGQTKLLMFLHHPMNILLSMSSLQFNQNDFYSPSLTKYIPENIQCEISLCDLGKTYGHFFKTSLSFRSKLHKRRFHFKMYLNQFSSSHFEIVIYLGVRHKWCALVKK